MWPPGANSVDRTPQIVRLVAVAIDKDKCSQIALKWAVDNLLGKGQTVILVHVRVKQSEIGSAMPNSSSGPCNNISSCSLPVF